MKIKDILSMKIKDILFSCHPELDSGSHQNDGRLNFYDSMPKRVRHDKTPVKISHFKIKKPIRS